MFDRGYGITFFQKGLEVGIEWYIMSGFPFDVIIRSWIECASSVVRACNLC